MKRRFELSQRHQVSDTGFHQVLEVSTMWRKCTSSKNTFNNPWEVCRTKRRHTGRAANQQTDLQPANANTCHCTISAAAWLQFTIHVFVGAVSTGKLAGKLPV